jgi:low affinity Fe/Cu permease
MEFLLFILAVIILVLILSIRNSVTSRLNAIQEKLDQLSIEIKNSRKESSTSPGLEKKSILTGQVFQKTVPASQPVAEKKQEPKTPESTKEEVWKIKYLL